MSEFSYIVCKIGYAPIHSHVTVSRLGFWPLVQDHLQINNLNNELEQHIHPIEDAFEEEEGDDKEIKYELVFLRKKHDPKEMEKVAQLSDLMKLTQENHLMNRVFKTNQWKGDAMILCRHKGKYSVIPDHWMTKLQEAYQELTEAIPRLPSNRSVSSASQLFCKLDSVQTQYKQLTERNKAFREMKEDTTKQTDEFRRCVQQSKQQREEHEEQTKAFFQKYPFPPKVCSKEDKLRALDEKRKNKVKLTEDELNEWKTLNQQHVKKNIAKFFEYWRFCDKHFICYSKTLKNKTQKLYPFHFFIKHTSQAQYKRLNQVNKSNPSVQLINPVPQ